MYSIKIKKYIDYQHVWFAAYECNAHGKELLNRVITVETGYFEDEFNQRISTESLIESTNQSSNKQFMTWYSYKFYQFL